MPIDIWQYEKRGCWCADVPTRTGRKRLYLGSNEKKARAQLHRYLAEFYEKLDPDSAEDAPVVRHGSDSISLLELAVNFLNWNKANRATGTWQGYRNGLRHVTRRHKNTLAGELTVADIEKIKTQMIEDGYQARTINIMITAVKRLYNWGRKQGLIRDNPLGGLEHVSKHVNAPKRPKDRHLPLDRALEYIEVLRNSPPVGEMAEMLLLTGMRIGELTRVTWGDIDFEQHMIRLERHKTSEHTGRPRIVPLCKRALEILRAQAREDVDAEEPVFRGEDGQAFTVSALHCRLQRLRKKHRELKDFSFHKMRHTCATYLARQKVPERVAQAILGHNSTLMTRYYTATDPDEMIEAVEKLSAQTTANGAEPHVLPRD